MEITEYHPFKSHDAKKKYLKSYDTKTKGWPVPSETKMVDTSYGQTFVRISGPADAPPLVLLHGLHVNSLMWIPYIKNLSKDYRVYAVDTIGDYGRSVYIQDLKSSDDFVKWLDELFSALKLGNNINIIGHSYGGWLTSQYMLSFQNKLNKVILLSPAVTVFSAQSAFILRAILSLLPIKYLNESFYIWTLKDLAKKDKKSADNQIDEISFAKRCFKLNRMPSPTVLKDEELQNIEVPLCYLVGENEKIYSAKKAVKRLNDINPKIKTNMVPNAGHDLMDLKVEEVNRLILEFLKRL